MKPAPTTEAQVESSQTLIPRLGYPIASKNARPSTNQPHSYNNQISLNWHQELHLRLRVVAGHDIQAFPIFYGFDHHLSGESLVASHIYDVCHIHPAVGRLRRLAKVRNNVV